MKNKGKGPQFVSSEGLDDDQGPLTFRRNICGTNVTQLEFFDGNISKICETP